MTGALACTFHCWQKVGEGNGVDLKGYMLLLVGEVLRGLPLRATRSPVTSVYVSWVISR